MKPLQRSLTGILLLLTIVITMLWHQSVLAQQSALEQAIKAVVRIRACKGEQCNVGSGVIIESSGIILTAWHVLATDPGNLSSPLMDRFEIQITDEASQPPETRYRAQVIAIKPDQDLALLRVTWDEAGGRAVPVGAALALPALPISEQIPSFGQLRIIGYSPAYGDYINYPSYELSGFDDEGRLLKVQPALAKGYSGGPALVSSANGSYAIVGLVIIRRGPQGEEIALIRNIRQLSNLAWQKNVQQVWGDNVHVFIVNPDDIPALQINADIHPLDLVGKRLQLRAYLYDAVGQPWQSMETTLPKDERGQVVLSKKLNIRRFVDVQPATTIELPLEDLGTTPDQLKFRLLVWDVQRERLLWQSSQMISLKPLTLTPTATAREVAQASELAATPTATPSPNLAATQTTQSQRFATAIAATLAAQSTSTRTPTATPNFEQLLATAVAGTLTAQSTPTVTATPSPKPVTPTPTPTTKPAVPSGTVQGRVLWNEQPVQGATVYATDEYSFESARYGSATTDANGHFSISGVPEGERYLYVFGNQPGFWVSAVTPFQMVAGTGTLAEDTYLCKGFDPISPAEDQIINTSRPMLEWNPYPDAVDYAVRVLLEGESRFVFQRGDDGSHIAETSVQVDVDLSPGEYSWRVDAFNAGGHIIACSYWPRKFTVSAN